MEEQNKKEQKNYNNRNGLSEEKKSNDPNMFSRRNVLKALAGLPVIGLFSFQLYKKNVFEKDKRSKIVSELGLDKIDFPMPDYGNNKEKELIRIGIIGFGVRAVQIADALGFLHPIMFEMKKKNNSLKSWLEQENLHVAITGICDVFDLHAEKGITIAKSNFRPGIVQLPVKRYDTYHEMLTDNNIDAVIIATPDHHHARVAIDAAKAGKHIYLEKSVALKEEELNELYRTINESGVVFQLGHQITQSTVFKQAKEIIKKNILGKITLIETTTNRNSADGAWIRHLDGKGKEKPGDEKSIDWQQWLGDAPYVPFSVDRFYNWTKWFDYDHGMIGQLFSHEFDAVNQLLRIGIPKSASSSGGIYYWKDNRDIPDSIHCVFEYPHSNLTLLYSGNLASSRSRGRVFMGHDASMELGNNIKIMIDRNSTQYRKGISSGLIDTSSPIISFNPNAGQIDAVTSASEKYYAVRGLTNTVIGGKQIDVTHLHLREWLEGIRENKTTSGNIDIAYEEGITCIMAHRSYVEKRQVFWDEINKKII